ncbi:tetratricopeptide repeat protein [Streptomyces bambusae]|uniref:tetratricopeptide repeat protein n=1 Tax=Streptomyces bambusae TaxID=1550616 RepID=UPI001CFCCC0C|nr:tetratricopeptide repeat protein [Streptomyces bambusae]MCB5166483.1 tetratricopeptide repeat protein [Streptomyces bambusae]
MHASSRVWQTANTGSVTGHNTSIMAVGIHDTHPAPVEWPLRVGNVPLLAAAYQGSSRRAVRPAPGVVQVLSGAGGMGKTQLAAAYAQEALAARTDLVVWVQATEVRQVIATYAEAARRVRAPGADRTGAGAEADARAFLDWAATTSRSWLVVLDDVVDPAALDSWWPSGPHGQVLATTRRHDARLTAGGRTLVDVGLFTPSEAVGFLESRLTGAGSGHLLEDRAAELADALGYLPLALGHAAAYMINEDLPAGEYLHRLADRYVTIDRLLPPAADAEGYGRPVAGALLLSLRAADAATAGLARPILQVVALLDASGQPADLWRTAPLLEHLARLRSDGGPGPVTPMDARSALRVLHRFNLLTYDARTPHREVRIHLLVARAVRESTPAPLTERLVDVTADALMELWPDFDQPQSALAAVLRAATDALHAHAGHLLWHGRGHGRRLLFRAGTSLLDGGLGAEALAAWRELAERAARELGPDHPDTVTARANLAACLDTMGRHDQALDLHEQVLSESERLLGPDHPDTLRARSNLANTYSHLGRHHEARALTERVLEDRLRLLGPGHPDVLLTHTSLAVTLRELGHHEQAVALQEQAVASGEQVLGADHPQVVAARADLAHTYADLGRNEEGRALAEGVVADRERILGPEHPDTLRARADLAVVYALLGRYEEAVELDEQVLADRERLLGRDHPATLGARSNLAATYAILGRYEQALALGQAVVADRERVLGPDHPHTLISYANLGSTLGDMGRYQEAVELRERVLVGRERLLGPDHPDTRRARVALVTAYRRVGRFREARALGEDVLRAWERDLGPDDPDTVRARAELAAVYEALGRTAEARRLRDQHR